MAKKTITIKDEQKRLLINLLDRANQAQAQLDAGVTMLFASYDVKSGKLVEIQDNQLVIEIPDVAEKNGKAKDTDS